MIELSSHAQQRSSQRGIASDIIDIIHRYARSYKSSEGSRILSLSKSDRLEIREELGKRQYAKIEKKLNKYLVMDGEDRGKVITTGQRYRRIVSA